jgi:hypothetical protein
MQHGADNDMDIHVEHAVTVTVTVYRQRTHHLSKARNVALMVAGKTSEHTTSGPSCKLALEPLTHWVQIVQRNR